MFHIYILTDETGSWPLLTFHERPWQGLRTPPLTLLPLGEFPILDDALRCAADFGAATRSRLVEEDLDDGRGRALSRGPLLSAGVATSLALLAGCGR